MCLPPSRVAVWNRTSSSSLLLYSVLHKTGRKCVHPVFITPLSCYNIRIISGVLIINVSFYVSVETWKLVAHKKITYRNAILTGRTRYDSRHLWFPASMIHSSIVSSHEFLFELWLTYTYGSMHYCFHYLAIVSLATHPFAESCYLKVSTRDMSLLQHWMLTMFAIVNEFHQPYVIVTSCILVVFIIVNGFQH